MARLAVSPTLQTAATCAMIVNAWFSPPSLAWILWTLVGMMIANVALGFYVERLHYLHMRLHAICEAMEEELERRQAEIDRLKGGVLQSEPGDW